MPPSNHFPLSGQQAWRVKEGGTRNTHEDTLQSRATPKPQIPPSPGKPSAHPHLPWSSASPPLKGTVTSLPALQPEQARLPGRAGSCLMFAWTQTQLSLEVSPPPPAHSFHSPSLPGLSSTSPLPLPSSLFTPLPPSLPLSLHPPVSLSPGLLNLVSQPLSAPGSHPSLIRGPFPPFLVTGKAGRPPQHQSLPRTKRGSPWDYITEVTPGVLPPLLICVVSHLCVTPHRPCNMETFLAGASTFFTFPPVSGILGSHGISPRSLGVGSGDGRRNQGS